MTRKEEIMREALREIEECKHAADGFAIFALKQAMRANYIIENMTNENCGTCSQFGKAANNYGFCRLNGHMKNELFLNERDFCSRWKG